MIYKKSWKYILFRDDSYYCMRYGYYKLKALKDFSDVSKGKIEGFVMSYHNLSQTGDCWIYCRATVIDDAKVSENAKIKEFAYVSGKAEIFGNAIVSGNVVILDNSKIFDNAQVSEDVVISGNTEISGYVEINGNSNIKDKIFLK